MGNHLQMAPACSAFSDSTVSPAGVELFWELLQKQLFGRRWGQIGTEQECM